MARKGPETALGPRITAVEVLPPVRSLKRLTRAERRQIEEERSERFWDRLERLAGTLTRDGTLTEAAVGAVAGAAVGIPTSASIVSFSRRRALKSELVNGPPWYYRETVEWYGTVRITPLWESGLPHIKGTFPTIGVGGVGQGTMDVNMKEWFVLDIPVEVIESHNLVPGPGGVTDGGEGKAKDMAVSKAKSYALALGAGSGALMMPILRSLVESLGER